MLRQRVIAFFPTIKRSMAKKACDVVGVGLKGMVEETCVGKLGTS